MEIKLESSTSSNKVVFPTDYGSVSFNCPQCGEFRIIRSGLDRKLGNKYVCHNCNFVGP